MVNKNAHCGGLNFEICLFFSICLPRPDAPRQTNQSKHLQSFDSGVNRKCQITLNSHTLTSVCFYAVNRNESNTVYPLKHNSDFLLICVFRARRQTSTFMNKTLLSREHYDQRDISCGYCTSSWGREIWSFVPGNHSWMMSHCRIGLFYDHFIFNAVNITLCSSN